MYSVNLLQSVLQNVFLSIPLFLYCECLYQVLDYSIFHGYPGKKNYIKTIEIFPLTLFEGISDQVLDFDLFIIAICN